jgi:hypothetical protein
MPPPGQEERRAPDTQVYVVKPGEQNSTAKPVATIAPKPDGSFVVKLPPGKWCVVEKVRVDRPSSEVAKEPLPPGTARPPGTPDFACLDGVWRECAQVLEVDGKPKTPVTLTRYLPCSWGQRCPPVGVIPTAPPSSAP